MALEVLASLEYYKIKSTTYLPYLIAPNEIVVWFYNTVEKFLGMICGFTKYLKEN